MACSLFYAQGCVMCIFDKDFKFNAAKIREGCQKTKEVPKNI